MTARTRQEDCRGSRPKQKQSREHYLKQASLLTVMAPVMAGEVVSCLRLCQRPRPQQCRQQPPPLLVSNNILCRRPRPKPKQSREHCREELPQIMITILVTINRNRLIHHLVAKRVPPLTIMVEVVLNHRKSNLNEERRVK